MGVPPVTNHSPAQETHADAEPAKRLVPPHFRVSLAPNLLR